MKLWFNRIVDFLLWIGFCLMLSTGFILRYRLPPGSMGGRGLSIGDWGRHDVGDLHTWLAFTVCALVLLHLILHWRWLMTVAWPRVKWPTVVGLIAGLLLALAAWILPVEREEDADHAGGGQGRRQGWERNEP